MQLLVSDINCNFVDLFVRPVGVAIFDVGKELLPSLKKIIKCVGFFLAGHGHVWFVGGGGTRSR